jgi:uncharacterized protein with LGFP repeats
MTPIQTKYNALCETSRWLGEPIHEERATPDGRGLYCTYRRHDGLHSSIHCHPRTGAFETHGSIRDKWHDLGAECSFLGYPISDERDYIEGNELHGRFNAFQGGAIIWLRESGSRIVLKITDDGRLLVHEREKAGWDVLWQVLEVAAVVIGPIVGMLLTPDPNQGTKRLS